MTFASSFLLKLCRLEFSSMISEKQRTDIFNLIGRLIQTLSSPDIALDNKHNPRLHARFLAGLLERQRKESSRTTVVRQPPPTAGSSSSTVVQSAATRGNTGRDHSSPNRLHHFDRPQPQVPRDSDNTPVTPNTLNGYSDAHYFSLSPPQQSSYIFSSDSGSFQVDPSQLINADIEAFLQGLSTPENTNGGGNGHPLPEDFPLASMQSLKNWDDSMGMPGFQWDGSHQGSSPSGSFDTVAPSAPSFYT